MIFLVGILTTEAVHFHCNFFKGEWVVLGEVYNCDATVTSSASGNLLESVTGIHLDGKNNSKVYTLNVKNQSILYIPSNIAAFFPNIEGIQFSTSNLQMISAADLEQFPRLKVFSSVANRLETISSDIFQHTPQLQWISFNENSLVKVGTDFLKNLNYLSFADFRENICINKIATSREDIIELRQQLQLNCPPWSETTLATTTDSGDCELRCSLNEEVDEVVKRIDKQDEKVSELIRVIASYEERIVKLQRLVSDLSLNLRR